MGSEIAGLEARKRAAVDQEDYDTAKALKGQIERMRAAGELCSPMSASRQCHVQPHKMTDTPQYYYYA